MATASLGPTLPGLAGQTAAQLGAISYLFIGHSLGYMGGSFFGGRLYDRVPGHLVLVAMLVLMAAMLALVPLISLLWLLAVAWLLLGVSGGALDVGGNTLLVWVHRRQVGPYMNALHFFFGLGSFLIPIIVAQAIGLSGGIAWAYWVLALLVLPVALWVARVPSPPSPNATNDQAADKRPVEEARSGIDIRQTVILICLLLGLYVGAEAGFGHWIYTYAVALDLNDATTAAYLTSAFWGALMVGRLLAIPLAALVGVPAYLNGFAAVPVVSGLMASGMTAGAALSFMLAGAMTSIPAAIAVYSLVRKPVFGWYLLLALVGAMLAGWLYQLAL
jgi:fucose permease